MSNNAAHILIVDDELLNRKMLQRMVEGQAYTCELAEDGVMAIETLQNAQTPFDLILLDKMMPNMDGIETLMKIKRLSQYKDLPVILQSAATEPENIAEGIKAGAYYYLTKPFDEEVLCAVINSALSKRADRPKETMIHFGGLPHLIQMVTLEFKTLDDVALTIDFLRQMPYLTDHHIFGINELMINAIEHGNLEISYDEKTILNQAFSWKDEVIKRLKDDRFKERYATLNIQRMVDHIEVTIVDQGPGFDWEPYLNIEPSRAFDNHGRGIAFSKMKSFRQLEYRGRGNEIFGILDYCSDR